LSIETNTGARTNNETVLTKYFTNCNECFRESPLPGSDQANLDLEFESLMLRRKRRTVPNQHDEINQVNQIVFK